MCFLLDTLQVALSGGILFIVFGIQSFLSPVELWRLCYWLVIVLNAFLQDVFSKYACYSGWDWFLQEILMPFLHDMFSKYPCYGGWGCQKSPTSCLIHPQWKKIIFPPYKDFMAQNKDTTVELEPSSI